MLKNYLLILLTTTSLVTGCSFKEAPDPAVNPPPVPVTADRGFNATILAMPKANHYGVQLVWSIASDASSWLIQRQEGGGLESLLSQVDSKATNYVDTQVVAGRTYRYLLKQLPADKSSEPRQVVLTIPRDLEVSGMTMTSKIEGIRRLFLNASARLVTEGKDSLIAVEEIISDNAVIETFGEGTRAGAGRPGRDGGAIVIKAKSGSGTLSIYSRGESGGNGIAGSTGKDGALGKKAVQAISTHLAVDVVCDCSGLADELRERLKGINLFAALQYQAEQVRHRCIQEPTDGFPGGAGTAGGHGSHGGRGGDTAKVFVEVENNSNLEIKTFQVPGLAGAGGQGGKGGDGGFGGDGDFLIYDAFRNCRESKPGPNGPAGSDGRPGLGGQDGKEQPMCLNLGGNKSAGCNKAGI